MSSRIYPVQNQGICWADRKFQLLPRESDRRGSKEPTGWIDAVDSQSWSHTLRQLKTQLGTRSDMDLVKAIPKKPEMEQYLNHKGCRWNYIQSFFEMAAVTPVGCGHCDRCLDR